MPNIKSTAKVRDMTEGSIAKHLLAFSIPLFFGNLFQQLYSVVDTVVIGHCLGDNAIAAVGSTGSIYSLLINLAMGMNTGFAIIVTQAFGSKDNNKLKKSIAGMTVLNMVICIFLTVIGLSLLDPFMGMLNVSEVIYKDAKTYISIILAGMIATVLYNMFAAILRSVGNSRAPLIFLIISSCINIALDILFVAGFHLGVAGAAYATVLSQAISALISGAYQLKNYQELLPRKTDFHLKIKNMGELIGAGSTMALMYTVINIGGVIIQRSINNLGEIVVAAESAANKITNVSMSVFSALSTAASTFIGQNWGAGKRDRVKSCLRISLIITTAWSLFCLALELIAGRQVICLVTGSSNEELISYTLMNTRWQYAFFYVVGALSVMRTSLQSMGRKIAPILSSITELTVTVINALWLVPRYGYIAQCVGKPTGWILMTIVLFATYFLQRKRIYQTSVVEVK